MSTRGWIRIWAVGMALAVSVGCESYTLEEAAENGMIESGTGQSSTATGSTSGSSSATESSSTTTAGTGASGIPGSIKWLHTDVSSWPVTASLSASVNGGTINVPYSKSRVWPEVDGVNANPWVIVNLNGQWYAATFEYLRVGQTSKPTGVLDGSMGDHIKVSPLNSWRPRSGERFGLMVSGLARAQQRNVRERSNIVMVTWP